MGGVVVGVHDEKRFSTKIEILFGFKNVFKNQCSVLTISNDDVVF
jgi:hypothetical protein